MSPAQKQYLRLLDDLLSVYRALSERTARGEHSPLSVDFWRRMEVLSSNVLQWADVMAASMLRVRADKKPTRVPTSKFADILGENAWFAEHAELSNPVINWRAAQIAATDRIVFEQAAENAKLRARVIQPTWAEYRVDRFKRDTVGEIVQVSEQIELARPEIGDFFPFVEYLTRDDSRVRPTHSQMQGFVGLRAWDGWKIIRPKNGWNCRCRLVYRTRQQAIARGWMTQMGHPKFTVLWPSPAARLSYEHGRAFASAKRWSDVPKPYRYQIFPDPGWHGPKVWNLQIPGIGQRASEAA